jgi:hypothetical protein
MKKLGSAARNRRIMAEALVLSLGKPLERIELCSSRDLWIRIHHFTIE